MCAAFQHLVYHPHIKQKLDYFHTKNCIPNLLFHGNSGTGKRTLVYQYIYQIYQGNKEKLKTNVMFVNCAHGKGIKFIREELKFFAKSNLKGKQGICFKTIVLFNADNLTIDAQSALRRCIELFSYNTRFFIVIEDKNKLLNPILSRFCEIHVPDILDHSGKPINLHHYYLEKSYGLKINKSQWFHLKMQDFRGEPEDCALLADEIYEKGYSTLDLVHWVQNDSSLDEYEKMKTVMQFHKIRCEFKNEKLLLFSLLCSLVIR